MALPSRARRRQGRELGRSRGLKSSACRPSARSVGQCYTETMTEFETTTRVDAQAAAGSQDRVAVLRRGSIVVGVVADGAGGTSGGAAAATQVIDSVRGVIDRGVDLLDPMEWKLLLEAVGLQLENGSVGQTTAAIAATDGDVVAGASVGDSAAWLVGAADHRELTAGQPRKPLLGGGRVEARPLQGAHAARRHALSRDRRHNEVRDCRPNLRVPPSGRSFGRLDVQSAIRALHRACGRDD